MAIGAEQIQDYLESCHSLGSVSEVMILSTCNRTEILAFSDGESEIIRWLSKVANLTPEDMLKFLQIYSDENAIEHLFRVAGGLESMVIGETQIFGQVKNAYQSALQAKTIGKTLVGLCQFSFAVAKDVRSHTDIGSHAVSLGAAAVKIGERIYSNLDTRKILFVGAGEMIRLCTEHFFSRNIRKLCFTNRTISKARDLASLANGDFFPIEELPKKLSQFDMIVSCTASMLPIIGKGAVERAIIERRHEPMVFVDLAVPRDVEPSVSDLEDIFLFSVDDLEDIVRANVGLRQSAVSSADELIKRGVAKYKIQSGRRESVPALREFREYGESLCDLELRKALDGLSKGKDPALVVESLARGLTRKFLHRPSSILNQVELEELDSLVEALVRLYGLSDSA